MSAAEAANLENNYDDFHFFIDVFQPWHAEAKKQLQLLTRQLFAEAAAHNNAIIQQYIIAVTAQTANNLLLHMHTLVKNMRLHVSVIEKYGAEKIESWRSFYCTPAAPPAHKIWQNEKENYYAATDEELEAMVKQDNERNIKYHAWQENRKAIWYNTMQPLNFKWLPELTNLEGDYWVLYAVNMRDDYENWLTQLERVESVIDFHLDPQFLFKPYDEFMKMFHENFEKFDKQATAKRNNLIYR